MKVTTLDIDEFKVVCRDLYDRVVADHCGFDCIVGIATGGDRVAQAVADCCDIPVFSVRLQRPATRMKGSRFRKIVASLPEWMSDLLRIIESKASSMTRRKVRLGAVDVSDALKEFLADRPSKVLVVDDAVDSGSTLMSVVESLRRIDPAISIVTAVIVVTQKRSLELVDYHLFGDGTLVRFPWSADAKGGTL